MRVKEMCYEVCGTICVSRCSFCWSLSVWILISAPLPQLWLHNSSSHCTQQQQSLYTTAAVTVHKSSSHCTQQQQSQYTTAAVTVHNSSSHCTQQQQSLYRKAAVTVYWVIQRSWFARVNALCNLSRKKSREVAAHFRADFWVGVALRCV